MSDRAWRRTRAARRKSWWNLLLPALILAVLLPLWWLLAQLMWRVHVLFYPGHAGRFDEFWTEGISLRPFLSSFLLTVPLFFPAAIAAMLVANFTLHCIPPARRALDEEAKPWPGTDYRSSQKGLLRALLIGGGVAILLSLAGALTLGELH